MLLSPIYVVMMRNKFCFSTNKINLKKQEAHYVTRADGAVQKVAKGFV